MKLLQFFKKSLKKIRKFITIESFDNKTIMSARYVENGLIECKWRLSNEDKSRIFQKGVFCVYVRLFDITLYNSRAGSTCIMKEVALSRKISECFIRAPIEDGLILMEIGYRIPSGEWYKLTSFMLQLDERVSVKSPSDDSWFEGSTLNPTNSLHDKMYALSKNKRFGGSERIQSLDKE